VKKPEKGVKPLKKKGQKKSSARGVNTRKEKKKPRPTIKDKESKRSAP